MIAIRVADAVADHISTQFYDFARTKLNDGGVLVTQSGPGAVFNYDECFTAINRTLRARFDVVVPYSVEIPSFGSNVRAAEQGNLMHLLLSRASPLTYRLAHAVGIQYRLQRQLGS